MHFVTKELLLNAMQQAVINIDRPRFCFERELMNQLTFN